MADNEKTAPRRRLRGERLKPVMLRVTEDQDAWLQEQAESHPFGVTGIIRDLIDDRRALIAGGLLDEQNELLERARESPEDAPDDQAD